jgi:predicted alpha/beta hydrolase family esterase
MTTTLIIPGLNSSGSAHWQTWFEFQIPGAIRVIQADWKRANLPEWSSRVRREISRRPGPVLIAAHSFGALAAVQAAEDYRERIVGALLVAPADPEKFGVAEVLPDRPLGFPATIVASSNDPWLSIERARALAIRWSANLIDLGDAGHINADSGHGPWPFGLALLRQLVDQHALREQQALRSDSYARSNEVIRSSRLLAADPAVGTRHHSAERAPEFPAQHYG